MNQVDWQAEGFEGAKLAYLSMEAGFFYDRHRAANDCLAAIELLARRLPVSGGLALSQLLERARRPSWRIWAEQAPYDLKDHLKARGYRWNGEGTPNPKAWCIDVEEDLKGVELDYLRTEIYQRDIELFVQKVFAYELFSDRA